MQAFLESLVNSCDPYIVQIVVNIGIGMIIALGLNLVTGVTGQLSLGHAAFVSIGAFAGALFTIRLGMPLYLNLLGSGLLAALLGVLIGFPALRLSGDYLAIATLGFAEIIKVIFLNLDLTNRALGLSVPPPVTVVPLPLYVGAVAGLLLTVMFLLQNSRFGRALQAIREDETAAETVGINTTRYKILAFAIGAFYAGVGGSLYGHLIAYINPSDFGFLKSVDYVSMIVLGGLGSIPGTVLGTVILITAPEFLRFMEQYRMLVYGTLLVFLMIFRPNGLLGGVSVRRLLLKALAGRKVTEKNLSQPGRNGGGT